jgi:cytochrome P450
MAARETTVPYPSVPGAECPWPRLAELRAEAPVHELPDRPGVFVVSRYADAKAIFARPELFSNDARTQLNGESDYKIPYHVTASDPPEHTRLREIDIAPLRPKRLRTYEPMIREQADRLIDGFIDRGEVEFVDEYASWLPVRVMSRVLGVPESDEDVVRTWLPFEQSGLSWLSTDVRDSMKELIAGSTEYMGDLVRRRREHPEDDGTSILIEEQVKADGEFDFEEVVAHVAGILRGGLFTTAHAITTTLQHGIENPDQLEKVRAEPKLIGRMIEEALRLDPPAMWQPRRVLADTEIGGVAIPEGSLLLVISGSGNRDEERFECPERFDVERRNVKDHLSFGYGIHFCVGAPIARMEIRVSIERILARMRDLKITPDNDLRHIASPQFRGLERLHLTFDRVPDAEVPA